MIRIAQMHSIKNVNTIYLLVTQGNSTFPVEKSVGTVLNKSSKLTLPEIKHSDVSLKYTENGSASFLWYSYTKCANSG